jgi:acetyltransferase-like isoleucine patch superfamily enzyme
MRLDMIPSNIRVIILKLRLGKRIEVGFDTRIGPHCRLIVVKDAKLRLRGATLSRSIRLEASRSALLEIGGSWIGPGTIISAREHISIGDGSMIAEYVSIRDQNHVQTPEIPLSDWCMTSAPVHIGDDVWIAAKVSVVAGVTIADHALCAAGAVVTRDVKPWQKVGGVPARPLKQSSRHGGAEADHSRAGERQV